MYDDNTFMQIFTKLKKPLPTAHKYHYLLCKGLVLNGVSVTAYSALPTNRENCDLKYIHIKSYCEGLFRREYISVCNFPIIRHIMLFANSFLKLLLAKRNTVLMYDTLVISASYGAIIGAKIRGIRCIGIVTDMPASMLLDKNSIRKRIDHRLIKLADAYVFLTNQMNEILNKKNKKYIVLEGHADSDMCNRTHKPFSSQKKIVMYAGAISKKYGVDKLCDAFIKVAKPSEELHIYGDGDYANELTQIAHEHSNVLFHGNCPNTEVVEAELNATMLVNPRSSDGEYTKYSFPSKTMEYMASGTPVLAAKLAGIPDEYDDYLFYFDDLAENGMATALRATLDYGVAELKQKGEKNKEFVINQKTNTIQAKKVVKFINDFILQRNVQ